MATPINVIDPNEVDLSLYGEVEEYTPGEGGIFDVMQEFQRSEEEVKRQSRDIALMRHTNTQKPLLDEYQIALSEVRGGGDPESIKRQEALQFKQQVSNRLGEFVRKNIASDDAQIQDTVAEILANRRDMAEMELEELLETNAVQKALTEMYAAESVSDLRKRKESAKHYAMDIVSKLAEERGLGGKIWDWGTQALAPDDFKDVADLVGRGNFVDREGFLQLVQEFQVMDPDLQVQVFEGVLLPQIVEAFDDNYEMIPVVVNTMFSRDYVGEVMAWEAGDFLAGVDAAAIAAPVGVGLVSLGKQAAGRMTTRKAIKEPSLRAAQETTTSRSVPHNMEKIGNDEAAAEAATVAGLSIDAGDVMGMGRADAAMTASPFRTQELNIFNGSLDTVSDLMAQMHKDSVERRIGQVVNELKEARKGVDKKALRHLEKANEELPRELAKIRKTLEVLSTRVAKSGDPVEKKVVGQQIEILTAEARSLENSLKVVSNKLANHRRVDDLSQELVTLRAGRVPNQLSRSIREAIAAEQQRVVTAQNRAPQILEARKTTADAVARSTTSNVAEVVVRAETAKILAGISDSRRALGLSDEFVEDLHTSIGAPIWKLADEVEEISPKALEAAEKKAIQERVLSRIKQEAVKADDTIRSADVIEMADGNGFTVKYNRSGHDNSLIYKYRLNDVGVWEGVADEAQFTKIAKFARKLWSPDFRFKRLGGFVQDLTFAGDQAARIGQRLQNLDADITRGLSSSQRADLDAVLLTGDEAERVFTIDELASGLVETKLGVKSYDDDVIKAYYKKRFLLDELHSLRDHMVRKNLDFLGFRDMQYTNANGELVNFIAKPRDNFRGADLTDQELIWLPNGVSVGDKAYHSMADVRKFMEEWKDEGYQIVELLDAHRIPDGPTVKFGLVADGYGVKINALPQKVLNYKPGYIPRIYKPGYHFVKDYSDPANPTTLFATETKEAAEQFSRQLRQTLSNQRITAKSDREMTTLEKMVIDADEYGGLYTGGRKDSLLMVRNEEGVYRPERADTGEAVQRYIANISTIMPMNEYRSTIMQRWVNTVDQLATNEGRIGLTDKRDFMSEIDLSPEKKAMMEDARDYIMNQLRINTNEEKLFQGLMQSWSDALYGGSNQSAARAMARDVTRGMIEKDPVQQLKGFTFNAQLGMFNPRQLVVQVQNAAVAAAVDPKHAPAALGDALAMRSIILAGRKDLPALSKTIAKITGRSEDEMRQMVELFDQTGLYDSIKRTADYDASVVSVGGTAMSTIRKAAQAGRVFFTEGELMARLISFNIARRRLGPEASVREIFDEHLRLSMNMQSANAAVWQQNWLGVPLQYSQVFAKFYEALIPSLMKRPGARWTQAEAARVLGAQIGLYGAVGVPMAHEAYAYLADVNGTTPDQVQKEMPLVEEMFFEGLTGVFSQMLGFDNNFSKDLSLVTGTSQNNVADLAMGVYDFATSGQSGVDAVRLFSGPSAAMVTRLGDVGSQLVNSAVAIAHDPSLESFGSESLLVLDSLAGIASSWSNARKAIFLHDVGIQSRQGNTLLDADRFSDMNIQTQVAKAMGFETDIETAYWELKDVNRDSRKAQKELMTDLKQVHQQFMRDGDVKKMKIMQAWLLSGKSGPERRDIINRLNKGMTGDDDFDRQAKSYTRDFIISGGKYTLHPATSSIIED